MCKGLQPAMDTAFMTWMEASAHACNVNQFLSVANCDGLSDINVVPPYTYTVGQVGCMIFYGADAMKLELGDHQKFLDAGVDGATWMTISPRELVEIGIRQGNAIRHAEHVKNWRVENIMSPPTAVDWITDPLGHGGTPMYVTLVLNKLLNVDGQGRELEVEFTVLLNWVSYRCTRPAQAVALMSARDAWCLGPTCSLSAPCGRWTCVSLNDVKRMGSPIPLLTHAAGTGCLRARSSRCSGQMPRRGQR